MYNGAVKNWPKIKSQSHLLAVNRSQIAVSQSCVSLVTWLRQHASSHPESKATTPFFTTAMNLTSHPDRWPNTCSSTRVVKSTSRTTPKKHAGAKNMASPRGQGSRSYSEMHA